MLDSSGATFTVRIDEDTSHDAEGKFRPTSVMEKVSRYLEGCDGPPSRSQIEEHVSAKGTTIRLAIDRLLKEGYATEVEGPRNARLVQLLRPLAVEEDA